MRRAKPLALLALLTFGLAGCVAIVSPVDRDLSLPDAKAYTQSMEREIVEAMPADLVFDVDQRQTGTFLPCSRNGGEQWAGGLSAQALPGVSPDDLFGTVEEHFAGRIDVSVERRVEEEDSLIDVAGPHSSFWIARFDPVDGSIRIVSFSPCIYLPGGVWRGDKY